MKNLISLLWIILLAGVVLSAGKTICAQQVLFRIEVSAGTYDRTDTPMCAELDLPAGRGGNFYLREVISEQENKRVKFQIESGQKQKLWWILDGNTKAGQVRNYEMVSGSEQQEEGVTVLTNGKYLDIQIGDKKVLRYNHAIVPAPARNSSLYDRGGFIHPLWSPTGVVVTGIHPADHVHHYGIWMPWTHTIYEGKQIDFWNVGDGTGTVRFAKFLGAEGGSVYGGFKARQEHVALKVSDSPKVILDEIWDVRVYNVGGQEKGYWLIDFVSKQTNVAENPLIQEEYRYGGFGFRGPIDWIDENAAYLTSEGKTRVDGHASRARWCDTSGKIDEWQGVTFFSNPNNLNHPEPMRIWPPSDRYVFFNWAPSQLGQWEMKPGQEYVFRYRIYVHEGKVDVVEAERIWRDYAEPPDVKILSLNQ